MISVGRFGSGRSVIERSNNSPRFGVLSIVIEGQRSVIGVGHFESSSELVRR